MGGCSYQIVEEGREMKVCYQVEVDETETTLTQDELLNLGLEALADAYSKTGAYFDVGYNPTLVTKGKSS